MLETLKKLPYPLSGVILALFSLGNCVVEIAPLRYLLLGIGLCLLVALTAKMALVPKSLTDALKDPVLCSTLGTFSMALMVLSSYFFPRFPLWAMVVWSFGLVLHCSLIFYFSFRHLPYLKIRQVHASYFIVYVGIAMAAVTARLPFQVVLGRGCFYFALCGFLFLLPVVLYRYIVHRKIMPPQRPLFCITAAPGALCLTAYLTAFAEPSTVLVAVGAVLSGVLYMAVLVRVPFLLRFEVFYPSYAAMTFPFVINATAMDFFRSSVESWFLLDVAVWAETAVAAVLVALVLFGYLGLWPKRNAS
ncbi:MAG TPA: TDT family transporter [Firmicutes bacterium]|nr:TDT family transporter [Bacillota bacterium]